MDAYDLTAHRCRELLSSGEVSSEELTRAFFERIGAVDGRVQAFLRVSQGEALAQARAVDAKPRDERGPWEGVPIALKDIMCTKGVETTAGSKILKGYVPPYDATAIAKMRAAGLVFLGKLNMDEFAMGSSTENSAYQTTRNPWDLATVPGGSSGGSAAAVAAGETLWALGSDTGGSIRQPAALCGIVGMKPTYGAVSRYGLIAFASSLDQIGPLTRSVYDCALLLQHIVGHDPNDATSVALPEPVALPDAVRLDGLRVGIPAEYLATGIEPGVRARFDETAARIEQLGGTCTEISLPHTEYALPAYYIIAPAEASANLARFDGVRYGYRCKDPADLLDMYERTRGEGFGPEVKRRIMIGTYALSAGYYDAYYGRAQKVRTLVRRDFQRAFADVDLIASPTTPTVAFKAGSRTADPLSMYMCDICTIPANLAGLPAISIPCGLSDGLPVGFQLIGPAFSENRILQAAHALEGTIGFEPAPTFCDSGAGVADGARTEAHA
ncbi:MAG TPA: Asp-tRNA(Asn)/Glu-tRNA(Gln) amidotransferase subunit GatA [Thermoleophilia bacterium]